MSEELIYHVRKFILESETHFSKKITFYYYFLLSHEYFWGQTYLKISENQEAGATHVLLPHKACLGKMSSHYLINTGLFLEAQKHLLLIII